MKVDALGRPDPSSAPVDPQEAARRAEATIKSHVIIALAAGLVPSPVVDMFAVAAIEVAMIVELARIYNFPVPRTLVVYKVLIAIAAGLGPVYIFAKYHHALKAVPVVGYAIYAGALSLSGGISVYAVGKLFQMHFESGGTFLSSNNAVLRDFFKSKQREGRSVVPAYVASTSASF